MYPHLSATLFLDNLRFHRSPSGCKVAHNSDVLLQFIPPNTSHFLQPLDSVVFAAFKYKLYQLAEQLSSSLATLGQSLPNASTTIISSVMERAADFALTPEKIIASFKRTIFPWRPDLVLSMAEKNIGSTTSVQLELS